MTLAFIILNWQQDQLEDTTLSNSEEEDEDFGSDEAMEQDSEGTGPQARCRTMKEYQTYVPPSAALLPHC